MPSSRRHFLLTTAATATAAIFGAPAHAQFKAPLMADKYGLIGKMIATPGNRDALIAILLEGTAAMPGCQSYILAADPTDANAIWITEVWDTKASHTASLALPGVRAAIAKGRPLIAGFGERFETVSVGGHGLVPPVAP